jgi:hypothetical protein
MVNDVKYQYVFGYKGWKELSMKTVEISEETRIRANLLIEIYKAGRLFTKDRGVQRTCEVFLLANDFADTCGRDIAKAIGEETNGSTCYEILYNMRMIIRHPVGNGYCAIGIYDFDEGTCSYAGIARC